MVAGWLATPKVSLVSVLCIIIIMKSEHAYLCVVMNSLVTRAVYMCSRAFTRVQ